MTEGDKPKHQPETLMNFEPTNAPVGPAPTQAQPRTQSGSRTGASPRIPTSQVPAARSTPGTMAEGPGAAAVTGGKIMVGTKLGQIEITGVLGKGGMGQVFRGYHAALDIEVAIKVLPDELSRNEVVRQRFLREARLCIKLDHPNVVRVFNVDEWQGNLYLVLELIEGTDAAGMLKDGGRFRYKRALEIGKAAAEALAYAHTQGLVHRDVKPHNILLGAKDGKIKLSDFGLARAASSASHLTMSGQIMGTPHYMSPEQAESKEVTDKSDVYSLGVTLYHMLTGETPFIGDTPISVAVQHIAKEILYPEMRFSAFPKELVAVLKRMTAKDAAKRCSAKQAAVWLAKLYDMAGDEDVLAEPAAMKSLAPVVAESEAFRIAAEKRKAADERAREEAKSMVVMQQTMREAMAVAERTMLENQQAQAAQTGPGTPAASSQPALAAPAPKSSGMGKLVAAAAILVLAGGGAAGWYFLAGPGANARGAQNTDRIASDGGKADGSKADGGKSDGGKTDGSKSDGAKTDGGKSDGAKTDGGKTDGAKTDGTPGDGGKTDGSKTDGGRTDGGRTDGTPGDGTTPPPEQDNPFVATKISQAEEALNNAKTTDDLRAAKRSLDSALLEISKASAAQREKLKELEAFYARQNAYFGANEALDRMERALEAFKADAEADAQLNTALEAAEALGRLNIPDNVRPLIAERQEELLRGAQEALTARHDVLLKRANDAAAAQKYEEAETLLLRLLALKLDEPRKAAVQERRTAVVWEGRVFGTRAQISNKKYRDAQKRLAEYETAGIPDSQKEAIAALAKLLSETVEKELAERVAAVQQLCSEAKFEDARLKLDETVSLLPDNNTHLVILGENRLHVDVLENLHKSSLALEAEDFKESLRQLDLARARVEKDKDARNATDLAARIAALQSRLESAVTKRFGEYMAAAKAHMARNEFAEAGAAIDKASLLPLSSDQRTQLTDFTAQNAQKLKAYAKSLLDEVEKALNASDFDNAKSGLDKASAMSLEGDEKARYERLSLRFSEDAARRYLTLFDAAQKAIESGAYGDALARIDELKKLPVEKSLRDKVADLESALAAKADKAVVAKLRESEDLMEKGDFAKAKDAIDEAERLALHSDDLKRKVRLANDEWARSVEDEFDRYLKESRDACEKFDYKASNAALKSAESLPLARHPKQQQLTLRLSGARDDHDKSLKAHVADLFKQLEDAVQRGDERAGNAAADKLAALGSALTLSQQNHLRRLKESLTGESREKRIERMPTWMKNLQFGSYLQAEQTFNVGESIECVAASPDGKVGALGTREGKVVFYNLRRGSRIGESTGGRRAIRSLAVSPDGKWGACGNNDGAVVLFDLAASSMRTLQLGTLSDEITALGFSTDNRVLYVVVRNGSLVRYNVANQSQIDSNPTGIPKPNALAVDPTGSLIAVGGDDGLINVFEAGRLVAKRAKPMSLPNDDMVQRLCFSQDGRLLAAGNMADGVGIWNTGNLTEKPAAQAKGLSEWLRGVGFSPDGRRLIGFDNEKRMAVWDARSGALNKSYEFEMLKREKKTLPRSGYVGPDGTILIGTEDGELIHLSAK